MKNKINFMLLIFMVAFGSITKAQLVNINPDPLGNPWIVNDVIPATEEELARIITIIVLIDHKTIIQIF